MEKKTIEIPSQVTAQEVGPFLNQLKIEPHVEQYIFDFTRTRWCEPFALLQLAQGLKSQMRKNRGPKYTAKTRQNGFFGYACHMGFFEFMRFPIGKKPGQARGSNTYIPIENWKIDELVLESGYDPVAEIVDQKSMKLAAIMLQTDNGIAFDYVQYSIREIMRNCVEHSKGNYITFAAQFWPNKSEVEIGIIDDGIGLLSSLKRNNKLVLTSDSEALQVAILPSVSGVTNQQDPNSKWANSGYGLYMTSCLCGHGGEFRIISGNAGLTLIGQNKLKTKQTHQGTAVQLRLALNNTQELRQRLDEYRDRGTKRAKEINLSDKINASTASLMVSSEFSKN